MTNSPYAIRPATSYKRRAVRLSILRFFKLVEIDIYSKAFHEKMAAISNICTVKNIQRKPFSFFPKNAHLRALADAKHLVF